MNKIYFILLGVICMTCATPNTSKAQTWELEEGTILTETDLVTGIALPWEILWGPDDYIWATQRNGRVLRIDPLTGNYTTILNIGTVIPDNGGGEPGMLGMTLHPDFANTPKVFIVYNYEIGSNSVGERLVCYDWDGESLVNEDILIDDIPGYWIHNGSRLIITPDQKILMSTGDTGDGGESSQDITALNGKILRINLDGSIPADNPDPTSYTYSFGHRNSQGLCVGPTGIIYSSEHGQSNSDEFNIIEANRNYGWPEVEGACNTGSEQTFCDANNVREPLKEWSPCVAVNGIDYYNHPAIPEWSNSIVMGVMGGLNGTNGSNDRVSVLHLSADGLTVDSESKYFTTLNQRFRDVCINPYTGALYVALNGSSYPGAGPNKIKEFRNMDYTSNVPNTTKGQELSLYPNPADSQMTVHVSESLIGSRLQVFSYNGDMVMDLIITKQDMLLDITSLAVGSYWTSVSNQLGTVTSNFIKQ